MQELSKEELTSILVTALAAFRAELGSDVTAVRILTLLAISRSPGLPQTELGNYVKDMSQQGLSRNVLDLSARTTAGAKGPDLVSIEPDPAFRRRNILNPTPGAARVLNSITTAVNKVIRNRARAN